MKTLTLFLGLAVPGAALAQTCPPQQSDFDDWGWLKSGESGDAWMTDIVCDTPGVLPSAILAATTHLGLAQNLAFWDMLSDASDCNPNTWGMRLVNGAYAADYIGVHRDNDTFDHFASPGAIMPGGTEVEYWLSQFVSFYVSSEGYIWQCLAADDAGGPSDGLTFASNPNDDSALKLYYPWFWNKTVIDRASTLVHEAAHEFAPHLMNSACTNGASCDDAFMNANAQTFQIIYDAQALDAYQREDGGKDLKIVNLGNGVCGYLPLLPDQERFSVVAVMQDKLQTVFQTTPPQSAWPASAFIDDVNGTIYDKGSSPGGQAGVAYRIDVTNGAMWPCGKVCNPADFDFAAGGPRACNEDYQPANAQVNADNEQKCKDLNAQVQAGVTPAEHAALKSQAQMMKLCAPGISDAYIEKVCDETMVGADHVDDIEQSWGIPDSMGYAYEAEDAIRACQADFCAAQDLDAWASQAANTCFEWDDPAGCLKLACGDLAAIEAAKGRDSDEYFEAIVCRASELARDVEGLKKADGICAEQFNECIIRERYLDLWTAQLAGGECWSKDLGPKDPYFVQWRGSIGVRPARDVIRADRGGLMYSACVAEEKACEALQAALQGMAAKLAGYVLEERPIWKGPPLPDPWEQLEGRFDRELAQSMADLGAELSLGGFSEVPLSRDLRIRKAAQSPEAQVALAALIGHDTYFAAGGAHFAEGVFSPEKIARFSGERAQRDPYAVSTERVAGELEALKTLSRRFGSAEWARLVRAAPRLGAERYYGHALALLNARDGQAALAAFESLAVDLAAVAR